MAKILWWALSLDCGQSKESRSDSPRQEDHRCGGGGAAMSVQLKVSEVSAASPDMKDTQFNALVEDIRQHGQLVPIWKSGDEIIDGRKRARACSLLGIPLKTVDVSDGRDPQSLSYSLNILRTHYTIGQRAAFASTRATLNKGHVAAQMKVGLGIPRQIGR